MLQSSLVSSSLDHKVGGKISDWLTETHMWWKQKTEIFVGCGADGKLTEWLDMHVVEIEDWTEIFVAWLHCSQNAVGQFS
jgi:hypothetical protein